jgi:hypothetical protein
MEQLFEEDLAGAREVRLVRTGRGEKARPEGPIETEARRARRSAVGSGTGSGAIFARVGSVTLQKSGAPLNTHEQALSAAASGALLGSSLLAARFPRLVAWPLAATGGLLGGIGVLRAARSALSDGVLEPSDTDHHEPGER